MKTLTLSTGSFDRINTFNVDVGRRYPRKASLHRDMKTKGDGIYWAMQHCGVIAASYSDDQINERERLNAEAPIRNGEIVLIDGKSHVVKMIGDYSSLCTFEPCAMPCPVPNHIPAIPVEA